MITCPRCGKQSRTRITSKFNLEDICMDCKEIEQRHPLYELACKAEHEQMMKGNRDYEGIGCPTDLYIPKKVAIKVAPILGKTVMWLATHHTHPDVEITWDIPKPKCSNLCDSTAMQPEFFDFESTLVRGRCQECGDDAIQACTPILIS